MIAVEDRIIVDDRDATVTTLCMYLAEHSVLTYACQTVPSLGVLSSIDIWDTVTSLKYDCGLEVPGMPAPTRWTAVGIDKGPIFCTRSSSAESNSHVHIH